MADTSAAGVDTAVAAAAFVVLSAAHDGVVDTSAVGVDTAAAAAAVVVLDMSAVDTDTAAAAAVAWGGRKE